MSVGALQWSTTAIVTTHDWGVLIYDEGGANQLKGNGLAAPVNWLRSRLGSPLLTEELLDPLPPATRDRMHRLLETLIARGAIITDPNGPAPTEFPAVQLTHGQNSTAAAFATQMSARLQSAGANCRIDGAVVARAELVCVDGTIRHGANPQTVTGFRVIVTEKEMWLGLFPGSETHGCTAAAELLRHLERAGVTAAPAPVTGPWETWMSWLTRTLLVETGETLRGNRCIRLGWDPYRMEEHRLVLEVPTADWNTQMVASLKQPTEDLADPLVLSRRCAPLVDDITSPLGVPTENGLKQLPLQLSACRVRRADGSTWSATGHGWTLEEARGRAVGQAVLEHGLSHLAPEVMAYRYRDVARTGADELVRLRRPDIERWLAEGRGATAFGATSDGSAHAAAVRLAANFVLQENRCSWRMVSLPPETAGADLLALHQDQAEILLAVGLPFALVALPVALGMVAAGVSPHNEQDAAREAVTQALLHHQGKDPGNEAAAPRIWAAPKLGTGPGIPPTTDLESVLSDYGTPVVLPLRSGPALDAALPHRSLVLLIPGGA